MCAMNDIINLLEPYNDYILPVVSLLVLSFYIKLVSRICRNFIDIGNYNMHFPPPDENYIDTKNNVINLNGECFKYDGSIILDESKHLGGD